MIKKTIDFDNMQSRIDAARSLQDAGETSECESVILKLAKEITLKLEQKND